MRGVGSSHDGVYSHRMTTLRDVIQRDRIGAPRRLVVRDHEAYLWDVVVDGVPFELAWWVTDGSLRMSYIKEDNKRSQFVKLGHAYGPVHSLLDANAAVKRWVENQKKRGSTVAAPEFQPEIPPRLLPTARRLLRQMGLDPEDLTPVKVTGRNTIEIDTTLLRAG